MDDMDTLMMKISFLAPSKTIVERKKDDFSRLVTLMILTIYLVYDKLLYFTLRYYSDFRHGVIVFGSLVNSTS